MILSMSCHIKAYRILKMCEMQKAASLLFISFQFRIIRYASQKEDLDGYTFEEGEDMREVGERLAASYVNFYFSNDAIILPVFGGENKESDERAVQLMQQWNPDRKVIPVFARDILTGAEIFTA